MKSKFTIIITTFNRKKELALTLNYFTGTYPEVPILICDDASADGTVAMIKENYPQVQLMVNKTNKGLIYNRNLLLDKVRTLYVISIDDDAHFLTDDNLTNIEKYFQTHPECAVVSFRIFWGLVAPKGIHTKWKSHQVSEFAGGAHAMRMKAWREIPSYPDWYRFYGEEQFASLQFFKKNWLIYYLPEVLVHHRVSLSDRKKGKDYIARTRRALHASWSNYLVFFPWKVVPYKLSYSVYQQIRLKVFKGDLRALTGIIGAIAKLLWHTPFRLKNKNRLSLKEYQEYIKLPKLNLYWKPTSES